MKRIAFCLLLTLCLVQPAWAGMKEGLEAYKKKDASTMVKEFLPLAKQSNSTAQAMMAMLYMSGEGVPKDEYQATKWAKAAAEQGNMIGQFMMGTRYEFGSSVPLDIVMAYMWFNLAAAQKHRDNPYFPGKEWEKIAESAAKERDRLAKKMSNQQIAEAQRLTREWKPSPKP